MIDKYLRNDSPIDKRFLIKRDIDENDEVYNTSNYKCDRNPYDKYFKKDSNDLNQSEELESDLCNERNYFITSSKQPQDRDKEIIEKAENIIIKRKNLEINSASDLDNILIFPNSRSKSHSILANLNNDSQENVTNGDVNQLDNINENNTNEYLDLDRNYLSYENMYLNEGKIKKNIIIEDEKQSKVLNTSNTPNNLTLTNNKLGVNPNSIVPNSISTSIPSLNTNNDNRTNSLKLKNQEIIIADNYVNDRNEFKLKWLQEKIEEQIRQEYEIKIKNREREIESKTKSEFEEAMGILKNELERNLENEKIKLQEELQRKWNDKYQELMVECKSKMRDDKEQKLAIGMYQKLKPTIEQEIYKNEYPIIEEKIKKELENKLCREIHNKKQEEIERVKRKLEYFTKVKLEEMESSIKIKCKDEIEIEMKKDIERREKELKTNYLKKFENFKSKMEKQLKEEYESKKKEMMNEITEIKSKVYRQKCAEKLKLGKINKMKTSLIEKEKFHFENAEKLEKALQLQSISSMSFNSEKGSGKPRTNEKKNKSKQIPPQKNNNDYYLEAMDNDSYIQNLEIQNSPRNNQICSKNLSKIVEEEITTNNDQVKIQNTDTLHSNLYSDTNDYKVSSKLRLNSPNNRVVNLAELNKKFKSLSFAPSSLNSSELQSPTRKEVSLIIKEFDRDNYNNGNLKENLSNLIAKQSQLYLNNEIHLNDSSKKIIERVDKNMQGNNNTKNVLVSEKNIQMLNEKDADRIQHSPQHFENTIKSIECNNKYNPNSFNDNFIKDNSIIANCLSLKISINIPASLIEFGKFLIKYIENEENYRILYEKEFKKLKIKIKKIFENENASDHCLFDYLIELWDKIDITFCNRYKILNELSKSKAIDIYNFLDKETEYLTEYFQKSQEIFRNISGREKLKSKLQSKANRNILSIEDKDKFNRLTEEIIRKIKLFTEKHNISIIWKGLNYEWLVNYENWFYENNK